MDNVSKLAALVHFEKIHRACQLLQENGYTFIFADSLVE